MNSIKIESVYPKYKYLILTLFSLVSLVNGMLWVTFNPINSFTKQVLGITTLQVYFLSGVFMVVHPVVFYFVNYFLEHKGLKLGLHIGTALNLAGALIRCLGYYGYVPLIIGQTLIAISAPFISHAPSKIINEWFEEKKRPFFITIAGNMNNIGNAIGFLLPAAFIKPGSTSKMMFFYLLIVQASITVVVSILQFALYKVSPFVTLNPSAKLCNAKSYQDLLKNKNCIVAILSASLSIANFITFTTVLEPLIIPFGFGSRDASTLGFVLIFAGVGESLLFGILISKTKKYKIVYSSVISVSLVLIGLFYTLANLHLLYILIIVVILLGPGMVYIIPLSFDYVQLLSPGVDESVSGGLLPTLAQIFGIVQILICDKVQTIFVGKKGGIYTICMLGAVNLFALILGTFVKETFITKSASNVRKKQSACISPTKVELSTSVISTSRPEAY